MLAVVVGVASFTLPRLDVEARMRDSKSLLLLGRRKMTKSPAPMMPKSAMSKSTWPAELSSDGSALSGEVLGSELGAS